MMRRHYAVKGTADGDVDANVPEAETVKNAVSEAVDDTIDGLAVSKYAEMKVTTGVYIVDGIVNTEGFEVSRYE